MLAKVREKLKWMKWFNVFSMENKKIGWIRHVLTVVSFVIFIVGCCALGYMAWVLGTSTTISKFTSGTLMFTYSVTSVGLVLFATGLVGWIASASETSCVLKLYLVFLMLAIGAEIGGLITLAIFNTKMDDILTHGWAEVNQATRNIIQRKFDCCGFYGPREFAYTNYPIDDSCYETGDDSFTNAQQLKQMGCGAFLKAWFEDNKAFWCSVLAGLGGLQLMCIILTIHIIHKLKDKLAASKLHSSEKKPLECKSDYTL